jgi:hypothetical protein
MYALTAAFGCRKRQPTEFGSDSSIQREPSG